MAELLARGLREEGHAVDVAGTGEDALWMARAVAYDAIVLDVMLPGLDGFSVCRELRGGGGLDAGADADRARRGRRPHRRTRRRRRRLPAEAVLVRRAARAAAGARPPRRPASGRQRSRSARSASTRRTHRAWRGETELDLSGEGVRAARGVHAPAGRGRSRASSCSRRRGTSDSRAARTSSTSTSATCASGSTGRSARHARDGARRRLPAARGRRMIERHADPAAADTAVCAGDGGAARRDGLLHLPPGREHAPRLGRPGPARAGGRGARRASRARARRARPRRAGGPDARPGRPPGRNGDARRRRRTLAALLSGAALATVLGGRPRRAQRPDPRA